MSMKNLGLFASFMASMGFAKSPSLKMSFDSNKPAWNPNKDHSKFWDKHTRKRNKLGLSTCEQESLLGLHGKPKKEFLKQLRAA